MKRDRLNQSLIALVAIVLVALACTFNTEVTEVPKYSPNEPISRVEPTDAERTVGIAAAEKFHGLLNEGKFDELFAWIDKKSQLSSNPAAFSVRMHRIERELGRVESSELQRYSVFQKSTTKEIRLEYITKFSKEKDSRPRYELIFFELYPSGETKLLEYRNGIDNEEGY